MFVHFPFTKSFEMILPHSTYQLQFLEHLNVENIIGTSTTTAKLDNNIQETFSQTNLLFKVFCEIAIVCLPKLSSLQNTHC